MEFGGDSNSVSAAVERKALYRLYFHVSNGIHTQIPKLK